MGSPYSAEALDPLVKEYQSGKSLQEMYSLRGISPVVLRKELQRRGLEVRRQKEAKEILAELNSAGISRERLFQIYIVENCGKKDLQELIFTTTGNRVGNRCLNSILDIYDLQKSFKLVKELQGKRSRELHSQTLKMLAAAGFENLDSLGDYYTENTDLTSQDLADFLNREAGTDTFTSRWIERHLISAGRTQRLRGDSRAAQSFGAWLTTIYSGKIQENCRSLIAPYEVDFYLETVNSAIEFNGDYWHSDRFLLANHGMTAEEYHKMKLQLCSEKNVALLFVWESDWMNRKVLVQSAVENFLVCSDIQPLLTRITPP